MVSIPPMGAPVTMPVLPIVALVLLLLQTPPVTRSVRCTVAPPHRMAAPVMVPAVRYAPMLMTLVVEAVPHGVVMV
jgi:hypothetical protein